MPLQFMASDETFSRREKVAEGRTRGVSFPGIAMHAPRPGALIPLPKKSAGEDTRATAELPRGYRFFQTSSIFLPMSDGALTT